MIEKVWKIIIILVIFLAIISVIVIPQQGQIGATLLLFDLGVGIMAFIWYIVVANKYENDYEISIRIKEINKNKKELKSKKAHLRYIRKILKGI
jgi:hypothetical protein